MHIGQFISSELKKQRFSVAEVASMMNKTDTGVRKDLNKDSLHQSLIESYSKLLGINIYHVLAQEYDGNPYEEKDASEAEVSQVSDTPQEVYTASTPIEVLSLNISVPTDKREAFLKLLLS